MKTKFSCLLLLISFQINAQATFFKTYGTSEREESFNVFGTNDNEIIVCGYTQKGLSENEKDAFIIKLNEGGEIQWAKKIPSDTRKDEIREVKQLVDGTYIVLGNIENDCFLMKLDALGDVLWSKRYGGSRPEFSYSFIQTSDGGFLISMRTESFGAGAQDFLLLKTDNDGNQEWATVLGGPSNDFLSNGIIETPTGYLVVGSTNSYGGGTDNSCILKLTKNGDYQWAKTYSGSDNDGFEDIISLNGNYVCSGNTWSWGSKNKNFMVEIDEDGNLQWAKVYGIFNKNVRSFSIAPWKDGFVSILYDFTNRFSDDAYLYAIDGAGEISWARNFGEDNFQRFTSLHVNNNAIYATGFTNNKGQGDLDITVAKTDLNGIVNDCEFPDFPLIIEDVNPVIENFSPTVTNVMLGETINITLTDFPIVGDFICETILPPIADFLTSELEICENECIDFMDQSSQNPTSWEWSFPGAINSSSFIQNPTNICFPNAGTYTISLTVSNSGGTDSFMQEFTVIPSVEVNLGADTTLCAEEELILDIAKTGATYNWSTGSDQSSITVKNAGNYWVEVVVDNCISKDSIIIYSEEDLNLNLGDDQILCEGDVLLLNASTDNATSYQWQDGSITSTYEVSVSGAYAVTISNDCETVSDEIFIEFQDLSLEFTLGPDTSICKETLVISADHPNATTYLWQDGSNAKSIIIKESGIYKVTVSNECYIEQDEILITQSEDCCSFLDLPNVFSPNSDGINDEFIAITKCLVLSFSFRIFNRWGDLVYTGDDYLEGWDGIFQAKEMPSDVYIWVIEYDTGEGPIKLSGDVTLIR